MTVRAEHVDGDRYRVRIYTGTHPHTGRPQQRSRYFRADSQRAADKQAPGIEADMRAEVAEQAKVVGTVAECVDRWLLIQHSKSTLSPTYLRRADAICGRIRSQLGRIKATDLSRRHVEDWYVWLRGLDRGGGRRMSEATVLHHHRILSAVLTVALDAGMVNRVVTEKRAPKAPKYDLRLPSDAELAALIAAAPPNLRAVATFAAFTGLRRGEIFGLRWTDVEPGIIHVRQAVVELKGGVLLDKVPKSRRPRDVYVDEAVDRALVAWRAELEALAARRHGTLAADARVFPNLSADKTGWTPMRPGWLSLAWARHCKAQGVHVRVHDLRHWYASRLMARATPKDAQDALGHAMLSTTLNLYSHATEGSADRVRAAMRGALETFPPLPIDSQ